MVETSITGRLADFAHTASEVGLPDDLLVDAVRRFSDFVGNCLAAHRETVADVLRGYLDWNHQGPASAIGTAARLTTADAAFWNGSLAHALDFDDTHLESMLHPTAVVGAAALAAAESRGVDGERFLTALIVGNEVAIRVGLAATPAGGSSQFFARGLHPTSVGGTFGAAVATSLLLGSAREQTSNSLAIATSLASGIIEANRTGGTVKQIHCGQAASNGVAAAELAAHGLTGPPTAFEGDFGFIAAYIGEGGEPARLTDSLGDTWHCRAAAFKPYPTNVFVHGVVEAAMELRRQGLELDDVREVRLGLPSAVLRSVAEPADVKASPPTGYSAKFSAPFLFALALKAGSDRGLRHDDFHDSVVRDERLRAVAGRVTCYGDERCDANYPLQFGAVVTVDSYQGRRYQVEMLTGKGTQERPMSSSEHREKFLMNVRNWQPDISNAAGESLWGSVTDVSSIGPAAVLERLRESGQVSSMLGGADRDD